MSLPAEDSQLERQIYKGMKMQKGTAGCTQRNSKVHNESQLHSSHTFANSIFILSPSLSGKDL